MTPEILAAVIGAAIAVPLAGRRPSGTAKPLA